MTVTVLYTASTWCRNPLAPMASLFKRSNGTFYASFYESNRSPQRKRFSLRTSTRRIARRKLTELEDAFVEGEFDPWASGVRSDPFNYDQPAKREEITLAQLIDRFTNTKSEQGRSARTLETYRAVWRRFSQRVGTKSLVSTLSSPEISTFCHDDTVSAATRHKRWRHLRSIFNWAVDSNLIEASPMEAVHPPRKEEKLPTPVREEDLPLLCGAVAEEYREKRRKGHCKPGQLIWAIQVFRWAFYTGMRASEIGRLKWRHIDRERGLIRIEQQKNHKAQTIPLIEKAREVLRYTPLPRPPEGYVFRTPSGPIKDRCAESFGRNASRRFCKARRRSQIERDLTFHDLRAGFATALADAGKSAHVIRDAMRHSTLSMALKYVNVSNARLRSELDDAF